MTIGDMWRSSPRGKYKKTPKGSKSTRMRRLRDLREAAAAFKGRGLWQVTEDSPSVIVLRRVDLDPASLRQQHFGQATKVLVRPPAEAIQVSTSSSHPISSSHLI